MLTPLIETLTRVCEPWQTYYADSTVAETAVTSVHLVALLVGGGIAVAADRTTLRVLRSDPAVRPGMLTDLQATHRPVLLGLAALFVSGLAMATADIPTFAASTAFLVKIALVALLCLNGAFLVRTEQLLRREATAGRWARLRVATWLSLLLWVSTVVAGTVLVNAA